MAEDEPTSTKRSREDEETKEDKDEEDNEAPPTTVHKNEEETLAKKQRIESKEESNEENPVEELLEERDEVSPLYVGRVIGKGGEMIRDLQARSACRIDVDQNVPEGAPRTILYRGTRKTINFAKSLVAMLCTENGQDAELPLGEATRKILDVPANVIGKIIGRGGEMIRELQNKSQCKIQVDHSGGSAGPSSSTRQVTLTGTDISVVKAEEMIKFLTSNPALDATVALNMLLEDKNKYGGKWGSGPPYTSMPNNGQGMQPQSNNQNQYQNYNNNPAYNSNQQYSQQYSQNQTSPTETEIFPCPKIYMGRVIGQKGVTVNDLQNRSGCDIQINQDVPPGQDCQITLRGARQGIEHAKQMLKEIIDLGPNHPYAGGRGGQYHAQQEYQQPNQYYPRQYQQPQYNQYQQQPQYNQQYQQPQYNQQYQQPQYNQQYQQQPYQQPQQMYQQVRPQTWKSAKAADGQVYYYNEATGETQWEKPPGF